MKQAKKYPAPQISEAVFRGRNSLYNFEVYPMNVRFNEVPAVYIISKRKIDRYGRGHHFLVCIGQTESLVEDIKMHKRGKCVKQLQANTVSVILEDDAQKRLEVENDLKAAHAIPCRRDAVGAEFVFQPIEKPVFQKAKTEAKKIVPAPPTQEIPAKPLKKPVKKQAEIKAEVKIEASKPKKAKKASAPIKPKADSEKINPSPKIQKVEKKPETVKSKKTAQPDKKVDDTKIKTKARKVKTQETEVSKAKQTSANIGKTKADNQPISKKTEASKLKTDAQKSGKAKADKAKINKAKTVETPQRTANKTVNAKLPKTFKALKTKVDNKAQIKTKVSAEAKTKQKTGKTKAGADSKPLKPAKADERKTSKITKPAKVNQAKVNRSKANGKTEASKSAQPNSLKVGANTKAKISIKPSIKGKENRLKTSSRKRLAF
ncbi:MAG TPA: hypothetical protein VF604_10715 [Pyrinomonadaceae bacterium]|jgi:hypothetical protein